MSQAYQDYCNANYGPEDEYDDYDAERDCMHEHYEIDVCTGRAECDYCPKSWYMSSEEIDAELERQTNYQDECEREDRRQRSSGVLAQGDVAYPLADLPHPGACVAAQITIRPD